MLQQIIEQLGQLIQNLFITPLTNLAQSLIDNVADFTLSVVPDEGVLHFCGACIKTFVPYQSIGTAILIITPVLVLNMGVALVLRVKSFIPTMGGK